MCQTWTVKTYRVREIETTLGKSKSETSHFYRSYLMRWTASAPLRSTSRQQGAVDHLGISTARQQGRWTATQGQRPASRGRRIASAGPLPASRGRRTASTVTRSANKKWWASCRSPARQQGAADRLCRSTARQQGAVLDIYGSKLAQRVLGSFEDIWFAKDPSSPFHLLLAL